MNALIKSLVVLAMGAGTVALCLSAPAVAGGDQAGVILKLPRQVLHLRGEPGEVSEAELKILPEDTEFAKMLYHGEASDGVEDWLSATIVLSAQDQRSLHRPEVCLPGQGWSIDSKEVVPVELKSGRILQVMKLGLSHEKEVAKDEYVKIRAVYAYWYVGKDVTTPSTERRVLMAVRDNIFRNINHRWAYVSVMSVISEGLQERGRDEAATLELLRNYIRESVTEFQKTF